MLNPQERTQIKTRIKDDIEEALSLIAELEELTQPIAPNDAIGRLSRMDAINNKSVNEHLLIKAQSRLVKLQASLNRVEQLDYGLCKSCKNPIPVNRLIMLPETEKCVNCA